jgi:recombination protein RecT
MNVLTIADVRTELARGAQEFRNALPSHITAEKFSRVAITAIQNNPDLLKQDKKSLLNSCIRAAQDGLLPDGREAALVIMGGRVQYMPMVRGVLKMIRNSGEVSSITAQVVYEQDEFEFVMGDEERLTHKPDLFNASRGKAIAVYAIARLKDGEIVREVMTVADVEKVRKSSRSGNSGPWASWWEEMAKKTVIRRLAKRLPMSSDRDDDERAMNAIEQDVGFQPAAGGQVVEGEIVEVAAVTDLSDPFATGATDHLAGLTEDAE